jgi:hypothetical protein
MKVFTFLLVFVSIIGKAQSNKWKVYSKEEDYCNISLSLYNDSSYFYEKNCDWNSNINVGNWQFLNDTFFLTQIDTSNFKYVESIIKTRVTPLDSFLTIKIIDKNSKPVEGFEVISIPSDVDHALLTYKGIMIVDKNGMITKSVSSDSSGLITFRNRKIGTLKLLDIRQIFRKDILINYNIDLENYITVKLNLQKDLFRYPSIDWIKMDSLKIENEPFVFRTYKCKNK